MWITPRWMRMWCLMCDGHSCIFTFSFLVRRGIESEFSHSWLQRDKCEKRNETHSLWQFLIRPVHPHSRNWQHIYVNACGNGRKQQTNKTHNKFGIYASSFGRRVDLIVFWVGSATQLLSVELLFCRVLRSSYFSPLFYEWWDNA